MGMEAEDAEQAEQLMQMLRCYEKARSEGVAPENLEMEALLAAMKQEEYAIDTNLKLPGASDGDDDVKREEILPKAFFVVKTFNEKKKKVFINMCGSDKIPGPGNWEEGIPPAVEEALASMESDEESVQNLRLPLSCSEPLTSSDHSRNPCLVYDVVYSLSVVEAAMSAKRLKIFIIDTALTWIGQKYNTQLSADFKLPNLKYKGDFVRTQFIRAAPRGPLISEISDMQTELEPSFPLLTTNQHLKRHLNVSSVPDLESSTTDAKQMSHRETGQSKCSCLPANRQAPDSLSSSSTSKPENLQSTKAYIETDSRECSLLPENPEAVESISEISDDKLLSHERPTSVPSVSVSSEQHADGNASQDHESVHYDLQQSSDELQLPLVQTEYLGRPVDHAFVHILFPSVVKLEDLAVYSTNTEVYVETAAFKPLQVPLLFPISPEKAQVELSSRDDIVTLKLPYLGYTKLYCCACEIQNLVIALILVAAW